MVIFFLSINFLQLLNAVNKITREVHPDYWKTRSLSLGNPSQPQPALP